MDAITAKKMSRRVLLAGILSNFSVGILYTWSNLKDVIEYKIDPETGLRLYSEWAISQLSLPYSSGGMVFAAILSVAGTLQDKIGPRKVMLAGVAMTGLGTILSGFATHTPFLFFITFGVIVGGGIALSLDKISTNSKTRNNNFNHFKVLRVNSKLYSTGGVSQKSAIARMMLGADVWSNSQSGANTVASSTSLNLGGSKTPIGPERDKNKSGYYRHYHTNPRKKSGGHSFYGGPA